MNTEKKKTCLFRGEEGSRRGRYFALYVYIPYVEKTSLRCLYAIPIRPESGEIQTFAQIRSASLETSQRLSFAGNQTEGFSCALPLSTPPHWRWGAVALGR